MTSRGVLVFWLATGLILSGCAADDEPEQPVAEKTTEGPVDEPTGVDDADDELDDEPPADDTTLVEEVDLANWESQRPECAPGDDRTVTTLDPVIVPAVEVPAIEIPGQTIGDEVVEGVSIPAETIPEQVVDTGCIVEHHAPAGCLGRVEISAVEIPGVEIPGVEIPGASVGDRSVDARAVDSRAVDSRQVDHRVVEERCQREPSSGSGVVAAVVRPAIVRPALVRPAVVRPALVRPALCIPDGCIEAATADAVAVDAVAVDAVAVDAAVLDAYVLEGTDAEYIEEEERTTYLTPADVLFEFDEFELTDAATPTLERIADEILAAGDAEVSVEGHTDGVGSDDYNQQLSEDRAQAVATWLVEQGGVDADRITATGYGSSNPVADEQTSSGEDDPEGRALNRRVVISVATS